MTASLSSVTHALLGKSSLEDCTVSSLRQLCADYPWLPTAHLLLAKKLKMDQDPTWTAAYEKALLFFPSTSWLNLLLEVQPTSVSTASLQQPTASVTEALTFEPYHTIDYFASQGIQFKMEDEPTDKFGKQLKSFTEWIKTMKKLPLAEIGKSIDPQEETKVEQLASHSLNQQDVVTESMAEIWIKQGNLAKAREVFQKLSLLDPSKSAYFAEKLNDLNK
jgi:hypothetical protein